jgi:hypothetical protein
MLENLSGKGFICLELGMVVYVYNPSTREAETGGSGVPGQFGLHSETLSLKKKKKKFILGNI